MPSLFFCASGLPTPLISRRSGYLHRLPALGGSSMTCRDTQRQAPLPPIRRVDLTIKFPLRGFLLSAADWLKTHLIRPGSISPFIAVLSGQTLFPFSEVPPRVSSSANEEGKVSHFPSSENPRQILGLLPCCRGAFATYSPGLIFFRHASTPPHTEGIRNPFLVRYPSPGVLG